MNDLERMQQEAEKELQGGQNGHVNYAEIDAFVEQLLEAVRKKNEWLREVPGRKTADAYLGRIAGELSIPSQYQDVVITRALDDMYNYGKLQHAMEDPLVSDIQIAGGNSTSFKKNGKWSESTEARMSNTELYAWITRKLAGTNYRFDWSSGRCDAILPDGARLHVRGGASAWTTKDDEGHATANDCLIASIRKPLYNFSLEELQDLGMFSKEILSYLIWVGLLKEGILVGGDVGSGKSTLLAAIISKLSPKSKKCVIEEMPELLLLGQWIARLYTRPANAQNKGAITMEDDLVDTLRMNFDHIFVGEIRTAVIAYLFLQLVMTVKGQRGATVHANGDADTAIERVCSLAEGSEEGKGAHTVGSHFCSGIRHVVTTHETERGFRVTHVVEVQSYDVQKRAIPYITIARWNEDDDTYTFYGVTRWMAKRAKRLGLSLDSLTIQEEPKIEYLYL